MTNEKSELPQDSLKDRKKTDPTKKRLSPRVVKQLKRKKIESYRSSIGNLYSEEDATLDSDITILSERGYWGDVIKSFKMYDSDELVAGLVDRMRYAANQAYNFNISDKYAKEDIFWKEWAETINETAHNVPMGLSSICRQIFHSMITSGMGIPEVKWGKKRIDGKMYEVPTMISLLPVLGVKLVPGKFFGQEEIWLGINEEIEKWNLENADTDERYDVRYFGNGTADFHADRNPAILKTNAEAIKFNWTVNNTTLYPIPLLKRSFHSISLRHKYLEADMSLLDGIIERIIHVKVGDKDIELFSDDEDGDGDLSLAASMFTEEHITQMIVTPYYYDIEIIQPDTTLLLKQEKYVQTTMNIMNAFGIILDPDSSSNTSNEEAINVVMFKEYIKELQDHVASWFTKLCREIQRRNPKLKGSPKFTFDTPDFDNASIKNQLINLYSLGVLDVYSLLEKFDFTPENILERLKKQKRLEKKEDILLVRPTYKQVAQNSENKEVTSNRFDEGGRPKKETGKTTKNKKGVNSDE